MLKHGWAVIRMRTLAQIVMVLVLPMPVLAQNDRQIGYVDYRGLSLLLHEDIEGVYFNQWYGKSIYDIENKSYFIGDPRVFIKGEGKTVGFEGVISFNCEAGGGHYWIGGREWSAMLTDQDAFDRAVPPRVIYTAKGMFCPK